MKKNFVLLALLALLLPLASFGQAIESYSIVLTVNNRESVIGPDEKMMADEMTLKYFADGNNFRFENSLAGGMMETIIIVESSIPRSLMLMNMMGMRIASNFGPEDLKSEDSDPKTPPVTTGRTKTIKGYLCKEYIVSTDSESKSTIWVSDKIGIQANSAQVPGSGIGIPLEMVMQIAGSTIVMSAESIILDKPDAALFEMTVPEGYTEMTPEELEQMGGGN
jgi:hypothetical protein